MSTQVVQYKILLFFYSVNHLLKCACFCVLAWCAFNMPCVHQPFAETNQKKKYPEK